MKKLLGILLVLVYSCTTTNDGNTTTTTVVPLPPTNLVGTLSPLTTVNLSWIDNSTNETGFKIERKVSGGDYALIGTTDADKTTFFDSGLSLGITYTYRVYAYNAVGSSLTYAYSLEIKTANVPILTTTLATLTIVGSASSGGNITDNSGSDVTARGVVWSTNSSPTIDLSTKTVDGGGSGVFTSAISGLTAGTTYYVRAYATNSAGTAYGNQITFTESAVPSNGLVGYWPFNGNANDMSGSGNNGTVNGATLTTDRNGNANSAYNFDGVTNNIGLPIQQNGVTAYSVSAWFKTSIGGPIFSGRGSSSQVGLSLIVHNIGTAGNLDYGKAHFRADGPFISVGKRTNNTYIDNQWHHFVGVYNGAVGKIISSQFSIYIDNLLVAQTNDDNGNTLAPINNGTNLLIGAHQVFQNGGRFNGKIDDLGIWNRALTQAEITALYNSTGK